MDRYRMLALWRHVRNFLLGAKSKDFFIFLFFFAVASVFWLLQALDEISETEVIVPIELTDMPDDVVVTSPLPDHLVVSVKDKGSVLLRYLRHKMPPMHLSFADYDNGSAYGHVIISPSVIQKTIQERLAGTSRIQSVRPDTLEFYYNHGLHATVPVVIAGDVDTNPLYYLLDLHTSPSEVKVYASASTLDTLSAVSTMPVNLTDLQESTTIDVPLRPIRGVKFEPQQVKLTATVDVYVENTVEVPVISLNFPADKQLRTFPSTIRVTYTIGYARSREVTSRNFVTVVTYDEILDLQSRSATKIPVHLKTIPEGVSNVRIEPKELDYLVESVSEEE